MADMDRKEMARYVSVLSHVAGILETVPLEELTLALRKAYDACADDTPGGSASERRYWELRCACRHAGNLVDAIETAMAQHRAAVAAYAEDTGPPSGAVVIPLHFDRKPVPDASA